MKLCDITKCYGNKKVFDRFSLEIEEGKILCILGESGGGKTTLLNILSSLTPFEGRMEDLPAAVSYIFQEPRLLPNLTVRENLRYVGGRDEIIDVLLEKAEIADCADKHPGSLSGGERQRVSFVRAFISPATLLLMDEPFSSLDTALKIRLIGLFARLWKAETQGLPEDERAAFSKKGDARTAVFVTHDIEEALMLADRIVVLRNGKIDADIPLQRDVFPSLYGAFSPQREYLLSVLLDEENRRRTAL